MSFLETIERARAFLERQQRVSLRALRREFGLDTDMLEELSDELVNVQRAAGLEGPVPAPAGRRAHSSSAMRIRPFAAARNPRPCTPCRCDHIEAPDS